MNLIKIEFRKLIYYPTFWVLSISYFLLMGIVLKGLNSFKMQVSAGGPAAQSNAVDFGSFGVFNFPDVWQVITYMAGFFFIIPAILIIITVCNEYEFRTFRQNLIDGLTKGEWMASKIITLLVISVVSTVFVFTLVLVLGYSYSVDTSVGAVWQKSNLIIIYFLQLLGYTSFAFMLANILKRAAITIGVFMLYVYALEPITTYLINFDLPMYHIRSMISPPINKLMNQQFTLVVEPQVYLLALLYTAIFLGVTFFIVQRRDA